MIFRRSLTPCTVLVLGVLFGIWESTSVATTSIAANLGTAVEPFPAPEQPPPPVPKYFGALPVPNSPGWARVIDRADSAGLLVLAVIPASPAASAGIFPGDVIVAIDEQEVRNEESAVTLLRSGKPNYRITLTRPDGKSETLSAVLSEAVGFSTEAFLQANFQVHRDPVSQFMLAKGERDAEVALKLVDELIEDIPEFAAAHGLRASLLLRRAERVGGLVPEEDEALAKAAVAKARELDPGSPEIRRRSARIFLSLSEPLRAEREAAEALNLDDGSAEAHNLLGRSRLALDRPRQALPHLHRAVELNPYNRRYYELLKDCYSKLGRSLEAKETDDALKMLNSFDRPGERLIGRRAVRVGLTALLFALFGSLGTAFVGRRFSRKEVECGPEKETARESLDLRIAESLGALGLWSLIVPSLAPTFGLFPTIPAPKRNVDIVEHILPGFVVLATSVGLIVFVFGRHETKSHVSSRWVDFAYVAPGVLFLAGFWIVSTHLALVSQALKGQVPWSTTIVHSSAGPAVMALSVWLRQRMKSRTKQSENQPSHSQHGKADEPV